MKVTEKVETVKQRKSKLEKEILTMKNSLDEELTSRNREICPFCGNKRNRVEYLGGKIAFYSACECEQFSKADKERSEKENVIKELEARLEYANMELKYIKDTSKRLLEESNLGRRFKERTFENFESKTLERAYKTAFEYAKRFEKNKGESLLFMGTPGTGKTHLAAAITNYVIREFGIPVKFGTFTDILESIKKTFRSASDEEVIENLVSVPLLVIDDLGKERKSEWSNSILYTVINRRYEDYLPVIITTNETMETLKKNVGEATLSRLIEMCDGVKMVGMDYRKRKLA